MDISPPITTYVLEDSINTRTFETEGEEMYGILDDLNDATRGTVV